MSREEIDYNNRLWYYRVYTAIVERGLTRGLDKKKVPFYTEKHHILPRCIGGLDEDSNYVLLSAKEHYIAHRLLNRMYPDNKYLLNAFWAFVTTRRNGILEKIISARIYARTREEWAKSQIGHEVSEETKKKQSESNRGKKHNFSEESKRSLIESLKGNKRASTPWTEKTRYRHRNDYLSGKVTWNYSEETRKTLSEKGKGRKIPQESWDKLSIKNSDHQQGKVIEGPSGERYENITNAAQAAGVTRFVMRKWINKYPEKGYKFTGEWSSKHNNKSNWKKVQGPDGTIYESINDAARNTGHDRAVIRKWIKNNPSKGYRFI